MKSASPNVVPNVFVKNACLGSAWAAKGAWVKRRPELNGRAPYEIWNHPELLLTDQEREENPTFGLLTLAAVRGKVIRHIALLHSHPSTLAVAHSVGNLPFATTVSDLRALPSVRDEDPASINDISPDVLARFRPVFLIPGTFDRLPAGRIGATVGPVNGNSSGSHQRAEAMRHTNRRARRGGKAFHGR